MITETNELRFNIEGVPPSAEQIAEWRKEIKKKINKGTKRKRYAYILLSFALAVLAGFLVVLLSGKGEKFFPYAMGLLSIFGLPGSILWLEGITCQEEEILKELSEISTDYQEERLGVLGIFAVLEKYARKDLVVAEYLKKVVAMGRKPLVAEYYLVLWWNNKKQREEKRQAEKIAAEAALERIGNLGVEPE